MRFASKPFVAGGWPSQLLSHPFHPNVPLFYVIIRLPTKVRYQGVSFVSASWPGHLVCHPFAWCVSFEAFVIRYGARAHSACLSFVMGRGFVRTVGLSFCLDGPFRG